MLRIANTLFPEKVFWVILTVLLTYLKELPMGKHFNARKNIDIVIALRQALLAGHCKATSRLLPSYCTQRLEPERPNTSLASSARGRWVLDSQVMRSLQEFLERISSPDRRRKNLEPSLHCLLSPHSPSMSS